MVTWRKEVAKEMQCHEESWGDVVACVIGYNTYEGDCHYGSCGGNDKSISASRDSELWDKEFCDSYGATEGDSFTVWTKKRVYFPVCYDGREWCGSASRIPDGVAMEHQGGG